ncbi:MAG TPA: ABC transporter ATP-binding protein [Negativicutes bacterium]
MVNTLINGRIIIQQISKIYQDHCDDSIQALDPITLEIEPGELVSIIGPSGCGKSTLLRLIAGLEQPTTGTVYMDELTITEPHYTRGLVFQDPLLFPWQNIWDNVATGLAARGLLKERKKDVEAFLELVGLKDFANVFPHQLSGGMAQRAALARALVNQPKVLLLDEPLGALDALTRMTMQDEILRIWQQRQTTILFVTHDIDEAIYVSDRVVVMTARPGKLQDVLVINLPRPRMRNAPEFFAYRQRLLALLGM